MTGLADLIIKDYGYDAIKENKEFAEIDKEAVENMTEGEKDNLDQAIADFDWEEIIEMKAEPPFIPSNSNQLLAPLTSLVKSTPTSNPFIIKYITVENLAITL